MIELKSRGRVELVRFSPDGCMLAAIADGGPRLWREIRHGRQAELLDFVMPRCHQLEFAPHGRLLIAGGGGLRAFDLGSGAVTDVSLTSQGRAPDVALSPDGTGLLVTEYNEREDLYDPAMAWLVYRSEKAPLVADWRREFPREWGLVAFLPKGREFVVRQSGNMTIGGGWRFVLRSVESGDEIRRSDLLDLDILREPDQWLISPDGRWIVDRVLARLRVYGLADQFGKRVATVPNDGAKHFTHAAFHPSGRYLAATSNDRTVKLYDTTTWKVAHAFDWAIGRSRSVTFSSDGMLGAAGGDTGTVVVWDVDL